jgi:hypothetical protein
MTSLGFIELHGISEGGCITVAHVFKALEPYALPISPKKTMKSMLLAKSHIAEFVDDFGLVGNA